MCHFFDICLVYAYVFLNFVLKTMIIMENPKSSVIWQKTLSISMCG